MHPIGNFAVSLTFIMRCFCSFMRLHAVGHWTRESSPIFFWISGKSLPLLLMPVANKFLVNNPDVPLRIAE